MLVDNRSRRAYIENRTPWLYIVVKNRFFFTLDDLISGGRIWPYNRGNTDISAALGTCMPRRGIKGVFLELEIRYFVCKQIVHTARIIMQLPYY